MTFAPASNALKLVLYAIDDESYLLEEYGPIPTQCK